MSSFKYTTAEQQLQKLKSQRLSIQNEIAAKYALNTYGYYNIINGYREPYITREYEKKTYNSDVSFEQIFALFSFDHHIRDAVLLSMIDLEEHLKAIVANIIAESFGSDHRLYLERNNYRDKRVRDPKFSRNKILADMKKAAEESHTQPIRYYRETHNIIPPWILFKGIFFGTFVNYIKFFKLPQREKLIKALYSQQVSSENMGLFKELLSDTLSLCLEYRNLAAHGGRTYNYIPNSNMRNFDENELKHGLSQLLAALKFFDYQQPFVRLDQAINRALNEYCHGFPEDIHRIELATGFNIRIETRVWINKNTLKFHTTPHCSGSKDCSNVLLEKALQMNYTPCKRCCTNIQYS